MFKNLLKDNRKFEWYIYITILSIFIVDIKIYVVMFILNIGYLIYLIAKKKINVKINKPIRYILIFIISAIITSIVSIYFNGIKINGKLMLKLIVNLLYLVSVSIIIDNKKFEINKKNLIRTLEIIIIANFIQVMYIYISEGLIWSFFQGSLTQSSDTAYIIGESNNVIGELNKNIWASKFTLIFSFYLYISNVDEYGVSLKRKSLFTISGIITILLLLSRTAQIAILIPVLFIIANKINKLEKKIKIPIVMVASVIIMISLWIFFNRFFHIKFDMTDGGFTRLVIWYRVGEEMLSTNFILGNGIGYSEYFIRNVIGRGESNVHNVILNILFEFGIVGCFIYAKGIFEFIKCNVKKYKIKKMVIIFIPIIIICNLQYLGFDNDLVVAAVLLMLINKIEASDGKEIAYEK